MPTLHVRDIPAEIHSVMVERAERRGMSLRQYVIEVLTDHCSLPTDEEWLDELASRPPVSGVSGAEAVRAARAEDDQHLADALRRS